MAYTTLVAGTTITASWANASVRDQGVSVFATAAARTSAVTVPVEGMLSYRSDSDVFEGYNGSAWIPGLSIAAWTDYAASLTVTASSVNPTKGNSTYAAEYTQVGKLVTFTFKINIGSTWVAGTGDYRFSLPVTADAGIRGVGGCWINDTGTALRVGVTTLQSTTNAELYISSITGNALGAAGSGTAWATGDVISATITYEAA